MTTAPPTTPDPGVDVPGVGARTADPAGAEALGAVVLPPSGDGERRRRRQERRRQRRRTVAVLLVSLGLIVAAAGIVAGGTDLVGDRFDDPSPAGDATATGDGTGEPGGGTVVAQPGTVALLAQTTEAGEVTAMTALFVREGGGTALMVPVGAMVEVPSFGLEPAGRAFELGGLPLLQQAVENLLGVRFDQVAVADGDALRGLVEPIGELAVEVPERVEEISPSGRVTVLFEPGAQTIDAASVVALLEAKGQGTDVARLIRHEAFWRAWAEAAGGSPEAVPAEGGSLGALAPVLRALAGGDLRSEVLPVRPLGTGLSSDTDLYEVDRDALAELMSQLRPAPAPGGGARITVQLLNGTGVPALAQQVTPALVAAGAEVKLVGNADRFDYETTQVVYYDRDRRAAAEAVRAALGVGEVVFSRQGLTVVDVTVVVGTDYPTGESAD